MNTENWSLEFWALLALFALLLAGMVAYMVWQARMAYLGSRFVAECGGYKRAARLLAQLEQDNTERLAGALSIHAFTEKKDRTQ